MYRTETKKYPVNSYIPTKVTETNKDLHLKLKEMTYNDIVKDFHYHFENCYITNFDLINNECRGDQLNFSRKFYETVFYDDVKKNLDEINQKKFISSAIKSERSDLNIEKKLIIEHFKRESFERNLEKKGIFLSAMRKKFYCKKTDECKSVKF